MREFNMHDYEVYAGAEPFRDGEEPMIHTLASGLDIIADYSGVLLEGYVGTRAITYNLYDSATHIKRSAECAAKEWIDELEPLKKHEQIALLHNIGLKNPIG